jgi:hypothetical protein
MGERPWYLLNRKMSVLQASLDVLEKPRSHFPCQELNYDASHSASRLVTVQTTLPELHQTISCVASCVVTSLEKKKKKKKLHIQVAYL